jgi:hypothetical protein
MSTHETQTQTRRQFCRQQLVALVREDSGVQARIAGLLIEVHDRGFWSGDFESFEAYCHEIGMALRTAQALMKTYRLCQKAGVSVERIESIGWSKVALLANKLTAENKDELLGDAAALSHAKLKEKYRPKKNSGKRSVTQGKPTLVLTDMIQAALGLAETISESNDVQQNLEVIAACFLKDYAPRHNLPADRYQWN